MVRKAFGTVLLLTLAGSALAQSAPPVPGRAPVPLFEQALPNVPGYRVIASRLTLGDSAITPHRHAGSVYLYVLEGEAVLAVEGQPERTVRSGESFFEPAGALHTVARSAVPGQLAIVLAVTVAPEDGPLGTAEPPTGARR